jgi:hypothetical protein
MISECERCGDFGECHVSSSGENLCVYCTDEFCNRCGEPLDDCVCSHEEFYVTELDFDD